MSETKQPDPGSDQPYDELDTEGQAFKWALVDEKGKSRLRQSWTPDDSKPGNERKNSGEGREPENRS